MVCQSFIVCHWLPSETGVAVVMSVRMAPPLPLILLLIFPGGCSSGGGGGWGVTHISSHICALEGSSVIIPCTYTYPPGHQVKNVFWTTTALGTGREPPNLFNDPEYRHRIQYLGDKQHNCTIRLTHVKQTDSHEYYFRFTTNITNGKWIGRPGVTLKLTDLQVEASKKVKERDSVTLTCKTTCRLTEETTFIWLKNMKSLRRRSDVNNDTLILRSVRREDAGIYSCSVRGHDLISPEYRLNVMYPPEKTLAVVSPSGEIVEGDSVTLTCSSDANPPVYTHTWFKEKSPVGSGNIYRITSIRSDHGGEYKCKVFNDYGMKYSNAVILNVTYPPRNVSVSISSSGVIVEGDSVNLTCSSESNPPVHNYSWFEENQTSSVGSGQSFRALESGWFYCVAQNKHGSQRSAAVAVTFDGGQNALLYTVAGVISGLGAFFFIFIILVICRKSQRSNDIRGEQDNDSTYQNMSKTHDDDRANIYTNFIPACSINQSVCESPADVDCNYDIYKNLDPVHMSPEDDVYCTPDALYDDPSDAIYINPEMCRAFESNSFSGCSESPAIMAPSRKMAASPELADKMVASRHRRLVSNLEDTLLASVRVANVPKVLEASVTDVSSLDAANGIAGSSRHAFPERKMAETNHPTLGIKDIPPKLRSSQHEVAMATCFTLSLMFLLMTADGDGEQDWAVNYSPSYVCALRGSTVRMSCTLKYPPDHVVNKTFWTKTAVTTEEPDDMCLYSENGRVQCHSGNKDTHSITLTDVTEADKHVYYCRFTTYKTGGEWTGVPGVQLDVTDLQVETQQRVKESDSVTLTCKTTCRLTEETTFIWSRNTQILTEHTVNEFHLQSVSRHDSGVYRCAIRGHERLSSPGVYLSVEYPPEKTSASISSSGVIVEGDSVTLTCSSESNPPVHIYSWFKENQTSSVGSGQTFSITNINSRLSGGFYCVAQNKHGSQRSAAVSLTDKGKL
ncbi:B-cell receptor CD22-like [Triplophysa rosa]|uniref:B-cell receptor CD22-like n=1 Tax=Triplophysa rosa TaxID=992332 RepID=UPI0025461EA2|nr:B-cell receptor CD22-like [Triplophysa rosa]